MFSPMGKKKILLQQKFGGSTSTAAASPSDRSKSPNARNHSPDLREIRKQIKELAPTSVIAATNRLENALTDVGLLGNVMKKILEATSRYRADRDSVMLKAFESRTLQYDFFRHNLQAVFWISYTDEEFQVLLDYFDPTKTGIVDGYSFMIAFTRLGAIRKARESMDIREKQEIFEQNVIDVKERAILEKNKKLELGVDYSFTPDVRKIAKLKLEMAAAKFDPGHPSAPNTKAFEVNSIKPATFREMLKLTLNLRLDPKELGAVLKEFRDTVENDIPASDFLKYFLRIGFEAREKARQEQRQRQALLDKKAEEEKVKKAEEANKKLKLHVDYNYSERDEQSALDKLKVASTKYDKSAPGCPALDGFECDELSPLDFKELVRRVFNLHLTSTELGFVIQKYDIKKTGHVFCKTFLNEFLAMGYENRHKSHIEQLERQRKLHEQTEKEHVDRMIAVQKSEKVAFSRDYKPEDLQSAMKKVTQAAVFHDKERGGSLISFDPDSLDLLQFKRALKRTFNIEFTAQEMGAMYEYLPKDDKDQIICHDFLTMFIKLGAEERTKVRKEQLEKQRNMDRIAKEEHEKKVNAQNSKILYNVEYEFDEEELQSALAKMLHAATKFDANHPAALSLNGFEVKTLTGPQFKELVRRTFQLNLTPRETGALFKFFADRTPYGRPTIPFDQIDSGDFLIYFLQLGIAERAKFHREQLEKQRREDLEREEEHQRKVEETANRLTYKPDFTYTEDDKKSIMEKIDIAAEKFDRNHPAAPSLEPFDAAHMPPGVFRENIKSIFGVKATPKEIAVILDMYDKEKTGTVPTKEFLVRFFAIGQKIRDEKHKDTLRKQREALKQAKLEEEAKLRELVDKSDYQVDRSYSEDDYKEALRRMTSASEKYDKAHPSAPSLAGFSGGPLAPGAFRELMKRTFQVYLTPKEVAAILDRHHVDNDREKLDGKKFLIMFMKLGYEARNKFKTEQIQKQRKFQMDAVQEQERKLRMALQRVDLDVPTTFTDVDRECGLRKIIDAAALYDKNAPGCVSLDSFQSLYLTPGMFKEIVKRTFNIILNPSELAAMIAEYDNGSGNVDTSKFLVNFIKLGHEEREKRKAMQIEKQRNMDAIREKVEELKKKEADEKMNMKINYVYTPDEKEEAFRKLAIAAKKFDKSHPAAMSLDGFEEKSLKPHVFREMLKRTFNFLCTPQELGALIHFFDQNHSGEISSKKFLIHFVKLGIAERDREHKESLKKLQDDKVFREKFHHEQMAAQWAKAEMNIVFEFTDEEKVAAIEKLTVASSKFDPASPGPMGLTAFQAKFLSPTIFREMLKRCFNLVLTNGELAALIHEFEEKDSIKHNINCHDFLIKFHALGAEKRNQFRLAQLEKQRRMDEDFKGEMARKQRALDSKLDIKLDGVQFSDADFRSVLEKIRILASNYDRSHPSAPSLVGFQGTDMKPNEFKDMLMRTFHLAITNQELAALVAYFPVTNAAKDKKVAKKSDSDEDTDDEATKKTSNTKARSKSPSADVGPRVNNREFLNYFNKIQRDEQSKRHFERILREREAVQKEKDAKRQQETNKIAESIARLQYTDADENTCVEKLKEAAREYAIDSGPYIEKLQGFKGPALPADKFRELFYNIFNVKFTYPELGVLLSILDHSNLRVFDGPRFLNFFFKISRLEEKYILGETSEPVTFETLQSVGKKPSTETTPAGSIVVKKHNNMSKTSTQTATAANTRVSTAASVKMSSTTSSLDKPTTAKSTMHKSRSMEYASSTIHSDTSYDIHPSRLSQDNDLDSFTRGTLSQQWLLPSLASADNSVVGADDFSFYSEEFYNNAATTTEQERLLNAGTKVRDHLKLLFSTKSLNDSAAFSVVSEDEDYGFQDSQSEMTASFQTPADVVRAITALGKDRMSVQTAPSNFDQRNRSKSGIKLKSIPKMKSAPFIIIPAASPAIVDKPLTAESFYGGDSQTTVLDNMSTISEVESDQQQQLHQQLQPKLNDSAVDDVTQVESPTKKVEENYLQSMFASYASLSNPKGNFKKPPSYSKDPLTRLEKIDRQFHQSPMAAMSVKQKMDSKKYRTKKVARNLAPIDHSKKVESPIKKKKSENPGGFFFPVLLSSVDQSQHQEENHEEGSTLGAIEEKSGDGPLSSPSKAEGVAKVPNIGFSGVDQTNPAVIDSSFLRDLLSNK